jgi:DNA-binding transcriptional regulator YdaS (Cro superfamily)
MNAFQEFVDSYGGSKLAADLGVSKSTISFWKHGRVRVPAERCRDIERLSGGRVSVHVLRPDVFGPRADKQAAA